MLREPPAKRRKVSPAGKDDDEAVEKPETPDTPVPELGFGDSDDSSDDDDSPESYEQHKRKEAARERAGQHPVLDDEAHAEMVTELMLARAENNRPDGPDETLSFDPAEDYYGDENFCAPLRDLERKDEAQSGSGYDDSSESMSDEGNDQTPSRLTLPSRASQPSSMLQLQVDDLIRSVKPSYRRMGSSVSGLIDKLEKAILNSSPREPKSIEAAEKELLSSHQISAPFPVQPPPDVQWQLSYVPPSGVNVVGSFVHKTINGQEDRVAIDIGVPMPSVSDWFVLAWTHTNAVQSLFSKKDYQNYRYFHKRAYYVARIASIVRAEVMADSYLRFEYDAGNHLKPVVVIEPFQGTIRSRNGSRLFQLMMNSVVNGSNANKKYNIRIIPTLPKDILPAARLLPHIKNVRSRVTHSSDLAKDPPASALYNASIQSDISLDSFNELLTGTTKRVPGFRSACLLGRIWLRQRGFSGHIARGGFGSFEWSAILANLLSEKGPGGRRMLSTEFDGLQLFRCTLQFLARKDLVKQQMFTDTKDAPFPLDRIAPTFFDTPRNINILYKMSTWSYQMLRQEAQWTDKQLISGVNDSFDTTFITKVDEPFMRYDLIAHLQLSALGIPTTSEEYPNIPAIVNNLHGVLQRGLGNRAQTINVSSPPNGYWPIKTSKPELDPHQTLKLCIAFDTENAPKTVDRGPGAEDTGACEEFRKFWGPKAELRRYKDGKIQESVVWSSTGQFDITSEIISYLVKSHFSDKATKALKVIDLKTQEILPHFDSFMSLYEPITESYRTLERDIRALEGLPLQVAQLRPSSPSLSYASTFLPISPNRDVTQPASVTLSFEGSARWPDDLTAIQVTKIAFLLKLSELLEARVDNLTARLGLENEICEFMNRAHLTIRYPSGATFNLRIHHSREQTLLDAKLANKATPPPEREAAASALAYYKLAFERRPAHTSALQILATRNPALSGAIRLTKRWFASHMLSPYFSAELIETFVAHTFTHPYPWAPPASAEVGFLRTLHFLSRWDWHATPLVVNFGAEPMKSHELEAADTQFEAWRSVDPGCNRLALFVGTNFDGSGNAWTDGCPGRVVADRMSRLAQAAVGLVREAGKKWEIDMPKLFKASTGEYDFVVKLEKKFVAKKKAVMPSMFEPSDAGNVELLRSYVEELQRVYGDLVMFFWDGDGGEVVAGVWNPVYMQKRKRKVHMPFASAPVSEEGDEEEKEMEVTLDKEAVLSEIVRLGGDLVSGVEQKGVQ